jgi:cysteine desulfurase
MEPSLTYLDHAATTPIREEVRDAMRPYLGEIFGNPSSSHRFGRAARAGLEQARRDIAEAVGCEPSQVVFTSGGTEADNLAIIGSAFAAAARGRPRRVAVSAIEHKAILAAAHTVATLGGEEIILPVDGNGSLSLEALDAALTRSPAVVSVMWVNNEVGSLQPIPEIAARCQAAGVPLHTDGVQAFGKVAVDLRELPIALLTLSGHKLGAPKGIGALVVRDRGLVESIIHGGGQQYGIRPGTENVAGAVALGCAARLAAAEQAAELPRLAALRDQLEALLLRDVSDLMVVGARGNRAPHILTVAIAGADSETLLMHLDMQGVAASGGSACSTGAVEPSHVLCAMGIPHDLALGQLRFSFGHESTAADVERAAAVVPRVVARARKLAGALGRA